MSYRCSWATGSAFRPRPSPGLTSNHSATPSRAPSPCSASACLAPRACSTRLEDRQELLDLVRRDLHPVVLPRVALDLDEAVEGMLAEDAEDQLGLGGELDRLSEGLGELLDAAPLALLRGEVVEVLLHRLGQLVAVLDSLETGVQHPGEAEIRVAGRVRAAQLRARRLLLPGVVERHADQGRAVAA